MWCVFECLGNQSIDYRSKGGLWTKYDPSVYASYPHFLEKPEDYWEMSKDIEEVVGNANPNPCHIGLAKLEAQGKVKGIITQNIDGLHQAAGSKVVYELHGSSRTATCVKCKAKHPLSFIQSCLEKKEIPHCTACNALVKTGIHITYYL